MEDRYESNDFKLELFDNYSKCTKELIAKNLIDPRDSHEIISIIRSHVKKYDIDKLDWDNDKKFLFAILNENTIRHFKYKLTPDSMKYLSPDNKLGEYLRTDKLYDSATQITTETFSLLGDDYLNLLSKYFSTTEKLIKYIHYSILDRLFELAIDYNVKREKKNMKMNTSITGDRN